VADPVTAAPEEARPPVRPPPRRCHRPAATPRLPARLPRRGRELGDAPQYMPHATGLLLVSPLFAVVAARSVFAGAAVASPLAGLGAAAWAARRGA